jgi:hypothetical protein
MRLAQMEPGPNIAEAGPSTQTVEQNGFDDSTVLTRSADLPSILDAHATEQVVAMVEAGWDATTAAQSWSDYAKILVAAAADAAIAETAWVAS